MNWSIKMSGGICDLVRKYKEQATKAKKALSATRRDYKLKAAIYEARLNAEREENRELRSIVQEQRRYLTYARKSVGLDYLMGKKVLILNLSSLIENTKKIKNELKILSPRKCVIESLEKDSSWDRAIRNNDYNIIFLVHDKGCKNILPQVENVCRLYPVSLVYVDARRILSGATLVDIIKEKGYSRAQQR